MKYVYLLLYLMTLLWCISCTNREERVLDQWLDKKVLIPDDLVYTRYGTDTLEYSNVMADYTVLMYVDTIGCTSCQLQLERWKDWITYLNQHSPYSISFLFDFFPKNEEELQDLLHYYQFDTPVCIDREDRLNSLNEFPNGWKYHTFLLDKDSRVLLVGNPVNNENIADLYRQILTPANQVDDSPFSEVTIKDESIDLGSVPMDSIHAEFILKNVGKQKLFIQHVSASCGCTSLEYNQEPVNSGDSVLVKVCVDKKQRGMFKETITIYCNTPDSPIVLNLSGLAV